MIEQSGRFPKGPYSDGLERLSPDGSIEIVSVSWLPLEVVVPGSLAPHRRRALDPGTE
jgi:hypothetical protein